MAGWQERSKAGRHVRELTYLKTAGDAGIRTRARAHAHAHAHAHACTADLQHLTAVSAWDEPCGPSAGFSFFFSISEHADGEC